MDIWHGLIYTFGTSTLLFFKKSRNCNSFERLLQINLQFLEFEFTRLRPKVITYRKQKRFDENIFRND